MPRGARLDAPGTLHHVMVRGIEGMNIVEDDEDREYFVTRLGLVATATGTSIYAWALMSNHAHMLLRSGAAGLSTFMRKLLTGYASYFNRRHKRVNSGTFFIISTKDGISASAVNQILMRERDKLH